MTIFTYQDYAPVEVGVDVEDEGKSDENDIAVIRKQVSSN
jgi:hypothetical protein